MFRVSASFILISNYILSMKISKNMSYVVKQRDNNMCVKCGETTGLTIDHIKPASEGGDNKLENLQTLCQRCNTLKANTVQITFKQRLKFMWYSFERQNSLKQNVYTSIGVSLGSYMLKRDAESLIKSSLQGEVAKLENKANDKLVSVRDAIDKMSKLKSLEVVGLENTIDLLKKEFNDYKSAQEETLQDQRRAYKLLMDHLGIEYVPETKKEVPVLETKMVEEVEPAHFIKIKKSKTK